MSIKRKEAKREVKVIGRTEEPKAQPEVVVPAPEQTASFEDWWIQTQSKYNLKPDLEKSMRYHFQARGFMDSKNFDAGFKDFGYRA